MSLHLITGYAGKEHITATDQGSFNIGLLGGGQFVLDKGNKFEATIITNTKIKILDGDILMQGRHVRQKEGSYEELVFDEGVTGYKRNDLIVARYTKDAVSGVEDCAFAVIKGQSVESTETPVDPEYNQGDITDEGGALINDMPLYRVTFDGYTIQPLVTLFKLKGFIKESSIVQNLDGDETDKVPSVSAVKNEFTNKLGGCWIDFTDADGNVTTEPYIHWLEEVAE